MTRLALLLCSCLSVQAYAYNDVSLSTESPTALSTIVNNDLNIYKQNNAVNSSEASQLSTTKFGSISASEFRDNKLTFDDFNDNNSIENNIIGGSTTYQIGRFSAETGIINKLPSSPLQPLTDNKQYFLQGSYSVVQKEKLNIAVLAKIETIDVKQTSLSYVPNNIAGQKELLDSSTNTTVGFIGFYSLTPQWAIVGALTSSQNSPEELGIVNESEANHSALIGTTYSF
ncbi:hypothetical protein [Thalassotalea sp. PLHSN55]|uniref:hypothetical protein n=1 Tax=Thalassotalea sp. PLHSN55 TaxID=3435888 RepID=UPI003F829D35